MTAEKWMLRPEDYQFPMPPKTDYGIGIVGCGRIAERNHIPGYIGTEGCEITAICDIRADRLDESRPTSASQNGHPGLEGGSQQGKAAHRPESEP